MTAMTDPLADEPWWPAFDAERTAAIPVVKEAAQELVANPETAPLLHDAGMTRDFPEPEMERIRAVARTGERLGFPEALAVYTPNLDILTSAIARRIVTEGPEVLETPELNGLLLDGIITPALFQDELTVPRPKGNIYFRYQLLQRFHFATMLPVWQSFAATPEFRATMDALQSDPSDDGFARALDRAFDTFWPHAKIHGLIGAGDKALAVLYNLWRDGVDVIRHPDLLGFLSGTRYGPGLLRECA